MAVFAGSWGNRSQWAIEQISRDSGEGGINHGKEQESVEVEVAILNGIVREVLAEMKFDQKLKDGKGVSYIDTGLILWPETISKVVVGICDESGQLELCIQGKQ